MPNTDSYHTLSFVSLFLLVKYNMIVSGDLCTEQPTLI